MRIAKFDLRRLAAIYAGGVIGPHRLANAGHTHLVWLNLVLSLIAGFAAIVAGHWLGATL